MHKLFPILFLLALAACSTPRVFVRTDGQQIPGNAKLQQDGIVDLTICRGETQKAQLAGNEGGLAESYSRSERSGAVLEGCMAQRGYVFVQKEEAEKVRESFAGTAAPTPSPKPANEEKPKRQISSRDR